MIARILISKSPTSLKEKINNILASHLKGVSISHPDVLYFSEESKLGIDQSKQIIEYLSLKPYSAKGRTVILEDAGNLTTEAQNALLKTLEELPEEALFILGADSDANFLPTVLSRCEIVTLENNTNIDLVGREPKTYEVYVKDIDNLIHSNIEDRFEYIEKLKKREEFLHALVIHFHQDMNVHLGGVNTNFLKELLQAEEWAAQNVNIRGILEYLMLVMPTK